MIIDKLLSYLPNQNEKCDFSTIVCKHSLWSAEPIQLLKSNRIDKLT